VASRAPDHLVWWRQCPSSCHQAEPSSGASAQPGTAWLTPGPGENYTPHDYTKSVGCSFLPRVSRVAKSAPSGASNQVFGGQGGPPAAVDRFFSPPEVKTQA
jgi:hypothetical protein